MLLNACLKNACATVSCSFAEMDESHAANKHCTSVMIGILQVTLRICIKGNNVPAHAVFTAVFNAI
jgi:ketopantoate reductase